MFSRPSAISAKDEMAMLSRHLGSLPHLAKHRISCIRTAIKGKWRCRTMLMPNRLLNSFTPKHLQEPLNSLPRQASLSAQQACELLSIGGRGIVVAYETIAANNDGTTYKVIIDEVEDWTVKLFGVSDKTFEDMVWDI
ncbi:hypothetical protein FRX31_014477 [Thalictrum thalictroides]|uniref:Uncharacterized protein n=1 Tax=Thalictrum thalictroides TaxID=46969 RepID=A0A7J6WGA2_THATH|nr:hypothetical protein FRX31_014477 [Thalictrum thalictroides]